MTPSRYVRAVTPPPDPPIVMTWKAWIAAHPEFSRLEVELLPYEEGILEGRVAIHVRFLDAQGKPLHSQAIEWEAEIERYLIDETRAPSQTRESEILRFRLLLNDAFRPIWRKVDGGYFDAVLVGVLRAGDYRDHPAVREMLAHARPGTPSPRWLQETTDFIEAALAYVGGRLSLVRADPMEADDIFAHAIAAWLDERFSVSERRAMGLLPASGPV